MRFPRLQADKHREGYHWMRRHLFRHVSLLSGRAAILLPERFRHRLLISRKTPRLHKLLFFYTVRVVIHFADAIWLAPPTLKEYSWTTKKP
jgi:hypothetical protein